MQGSLCHKNGVLYVGRHARSASIAAFDLDGHPLETGFSFRDTEVGRSSAEGLAVDEDHRIWVADGAARRVRAFSLFGVEAVAIGGAPGERNDLRGRIGDPVDVLAAGADSELEILVASGGRRRHALQSFHVESRRVHSLRSCGDPRGRFEGLRAVSAAGRFVYAGEGHVGRIQVFRDGEFHFAFSCRPNGGRRSAPEAVTALADGRVVVAVGGEESALLLFGPDGVLQRVLASGGSDEGSVEQPGDVEVVEADGDQAARVLAIDLDGERVQVFALDGRCFGSFPSL